MNADRSSQNRVGNVDRRSFICTVAGAGGAAALSAGALSAGVFTGVAAEAQAESLTGELYRSLSDSQRKAICLPFDHELRKKINPNWHITTPQIGEDFYSKAQRELVSRIVKAVCSEDGYERLQQQMEDDAGGLDYYSVAIFGVPGQSKFEFELTGRHLTLRADGNSADKAAFGGPIVYGHGEEDTEQNLFFYQTEQTNKVFQALSGDHRKTALLKSAPKESAVQIQGQSGTFPGVTVGELADDVQGLVSDSLKVLLAPYRAADVAEVMQILDDNGGVAGLNMAFYQQGDIGSDRTWDIWRVEGPAFVWHFRGAPHVHAYLNVAQRKA
jgi:Protein of unknown function (DUF3500)